MDLVRRILAKVASALPKRTIYRDADDGVYLARYYLLGAPRGLKYFDQGWSMCWWQKLLTWAPTIYLHEFKASDSDDTLHNHPWTATSLILVGGYVEERRVEKSTIDPVSKFFGYFDVETRKYGPGSINRLKADTFHRVTLIEKDCWSIIFLGKKVQTWGFIDRRTGAFLHWKDHAKLRELRRSYTSKGGQA